MSEAFDLHCDLGLKLYEERSFAEAIAEWRKASVLAPRSGHLHDSIGSALSALG